MLTTRFQRSTRPISGSHNNSTLAAALRNSICSCELSKLIRETLWILFLSFCVYRAAQPRPSPPPSLFDDEKGLEDYSPLQGNPVAVQLAGQDNETVHTPWFAEVFVLAQVRISFQLFFCL